MDSGFFAQCKVLTAAVVSVDKNNQRQIQVSCGQFLIGGYQALGL